MTTHASPTPPCPEDGLDVTVRIRLSSTTARALAAGLVATVGTLSAHLLQVLLA